MRLLLACAVLSLLSWTSESLAADNYWSRIGPFGGDISALKFDPANQSCALALSNGEVIYSCSDGNTWDVAYFEGKRIQYADNIAVGASRWYVYSLTTVLMTSTDHGRTWTRTMVPLDYNNQYLVQLQVDAGDTRVVYGLVQRVGAEFPSNDLVKSTDAGTTWAKVELPAGMAAYDMVADPRRSNVVYVGVRSIERTANAYYKSTDGGATWTPVPNTGLPDGDFAYLAIDPADSDTLYMTRLITSQTTTYLSRSTDGGSTWQAAPTSLPPSYGLVVVPDPVHRGTLYAGSSGSTFHKSVDGGKTWSSITASTPPNLKLAALVLHSTGLFAPTLDGLFHSSDDGATWQEITAGFSARFVEALQIDEPRIIVRTSLFASTADQTGAYFQTTDNATWTRIDPPNAPIGAPRYVTAPSVGAFPWSSTRHAAAGVNSESAGRLATLYRSVDDGSTWTSTTIAGADVPEVLLAASADVPPLLIGSYYVQECHTIPGGISCGVNNEVPTISTDGGMTWQKIIDTRVYVPVSAAISPLQPRAIVMVQEGGITRSIDGGTTFQRVPGTEALIGRLFADPHRAQTFYLTVGSVNGQTIQFYRSVDGGSTWNVVGLDVPLSEHTGPVVDLHFGETRPDRIDAITSMGILVRSEDRGATWKTLSMGPPGDNSATFVQFGRHDPTAAYLTTVDHGIFAYTIARDAPVDAVEFYNSLLDHYFMTAAAEEADGIDHGAAGPGWSRTGYSFRAWLSSTASAPTVRPACRFYGTPGRGPNSHFYTIDPAECAAVRNDPGWRLEATDVFYASRPASDGCASDKKAVYRAYNNRFTQNDSNHRYAAAPAAYDQVLARGWSAEGVVMCAEP